MASAAQILANRRNAEKSTGPRTAEGKAASSQNAVKHGLLARRCVIGTEDPAEFDRQRELMMAQLDPAGPLERVLAERIVSLSWRLKRAERMQDEALDCLLAEGGDSPAGESAELGSFEQTGATALGRVAVRDFGNERVLDRLSMYERRIEHSLYKTISELDRMKLLRPFEAKERNRYQGPAYADPGPAGGPLPPGTRPPSPARPADWQFCQTNPISGGPDAWRQPGQHGAVRGVQENPVENWVAAASGEKGSLPMASSARGRPSAS